MKTTSKERRETVHKLKVLEEYANAIMNGYKTFEIRKNDRDYKVGDKVIFNVITSEGMPKEHPLNGKIYWIEYILNDFEGLAQTYVALAIHKDYCHNCGARVVEATQART